MHDADQAQQRPTELMTPRPLNALFDAMHHGKYTFESFVNLEVSENYDQIGWANRTIYRPSAILKAFQSFLSSVLFEQLPVNTRVAFAYRKGTSLRQAVEMHAESKALYQTDFSKFFHSIDSNLIRRTILSNPTPVQDIAVHLDRILELTTINERLPIGFVTSPTISNACLKPFDDALETECKARALAYSRYADDLAISAREHQNLHEMEFLVLELARSHINPDLSLNESKSKLTRKGERLSLLGFDILPNGRITVSREIRHKVERLIHLFATKRSTFDELYDGDTQKGLQQLGGLVGHIHSVDPLYLAKLRRKYGATIIDAILHRSLGDE